jgi:hypothetical protein
MSQIEPRLFKTCIKFRLYSFSDLGTESRKKYNSRSLHSLQLCTKLQKHMNVHVTSQSLVCTLIIAKITQIFSEIIANNDMADCFMTG